MLDKDESKYIYVDIEMVKGYKSTIALSKTEKFLLLDTGHKDGEVLVVDLNVKELLYGVFYFFKEEGVIGVNGTLFNVNLLKIINKEVHKFPRPVSTFLVAEIARVIDTYIDEVDEKKDLVKFLKIFMGNMFDFDNIKKISESITLLKDGKGFKKEFNPFIDRMYSLLLDERKSEIKEFTEDDGSLIDYLQLTPKGEYQGPKTTFASEERPDIINSIMFYFSVKENTITLNFAFALNEERKGFKCLCFHLTLEEIKSEFVGFLKNVKRIKDKHLGDLTLAELRFKYNFYYLCFLSDYFVKESLIDNPSNKDILNLENETDRYMLSLINGCSLDSLEDLFRWSFHYFRNNEFSTLYPVLEAITDKLDFYDLSGKPKILN